LFYGSLNDTFLIALGYLQSSEWAPLSNEQARMTIRLPYIFQDMVSAFVLGGLRKTAKYPKRERKVKGKVVPVLN
jgi:hypothetical protein